MDVFNPAAAAAAAAVAAAAAAAAVAAEVPAVPGEVAAAVLPVPAAVAVPEPALGEELTHCLAPLRFAHWAHWWPLVCATEPYLQLRPEASGSPAAGSWRCVAARGSGAMSVQRRRPPAALHSNDPRACSGTNTPCNGRQCFLKPSWQLHTEQRQHSARPTCNVVGPNESHMLSSSGGWVPSGASSVAKCVQFCTSSCGRGVMG